MNRIPQLFHSENGTRDKFLSRVFGIFSEQIVRIWCRMPQAPYEDVGRPTLRPLDNYSGFPSGKGYTLDFAFRSRANNTIYPGELKSELEFMNYRYLTLRSADQLEHHQKDAFKAFLDAAKHPE